MLDQDLRPNWPSPTSVSVLVRIVSVWVTHGGLEGIRVLEICVDSLVNFAIMRLEKSSQSQLSLWGDESPLTRSRVVA